GLRLLKQGCLPIAARREHNEIDVILHAAQDSRELKDATAEAVAGNRTAEVKRVGVHGAQDSTIRRSLAPRNRASSRRRPKDTTHSWLARGASHPSAVALGRNPELRRRGGT